jgi:hypothetical protein
LDRPFTEDLDHGRHRELQDIRDHKWLAVRAILTAYRSWWLHWPAFLALTVIAPE